MLRAHCRMKCLNRETFPASSQIVSQMRNLCLFRAYYVLCFLFLSLSSLQKTEQFLPSYETVSFAVKSVFEEFNWTEAVILATGKPEISEIL